ATRPERPVLVQVPAGARRLRHARAGRRAVHDRLPQAGRVLRVPGDGAVHARGVLPPHPAADQLDDGPGRRPPLQPLRPGAATDAGAGKPDPAGGPFSFPAAPAVAVGVVARPDSPCGFAKGATFPRFGLTTACKSATDG